MGARGHVCQAVTRASTVNTEYRNDAPSASGSAAGVRGKRATSVRTRRAKGQLLRDPDRWDIRPWESRINVIALSFARMKHIPIPPTSH